MRVKKQCTNCSKEYDQKHIREHERRCTGEKPYICHLCGASFGGKGNLDIHIKIHSNIAYPCTKCNRSFRHRSQLSKHQEPKSSRYKFECDYCCDKFIQQGYLTRHLEKIHNNAADLLSNPEMERTRPKRKVTFKGGHIQTGAEKKDLLIENYSSGDDDESDTQDNPASQINDDDDDDNFMKATQGSPLKRRYSDKNSSEDDHQNYSGDDEDVTVIAPSQGDFAKTSTNQPNQDKDDSESEDEDHNKQVTCVAPVNAPVFKMPPQKRPASSSDSMNCQPPSKKQDLANENADDEPFEASQIYPAPVSTAASSLAVEVETSEQLPSINNTCNKDAIESADSYPLGFILEVWGIDKDFFDQTTIEGQENILKYLGGEKICFNLEQVTGIISTIHSQFGLTMPCVLLLDYCREMSLQNLDYLYKQKSLFPPQIQKLLDTVASFLIYRYLRLNCTYEDFVDSIPGSMLHLIKLDSYFLLTKEESIPEEPARLITTFEEQKCLEKLHKLMVENIVGDMFDAEKSLLNKNVTTKDRIQKWTQFVIQFVSRLISEENKHPFEMLLLLELELGVNTQKVLKIKSGSAVTSLFLHHQILNHLGGKSTTQIVEATEEDKQVIITLLYKKQDYFFTKSKLTMGVFNLACKLQIADVWTFLFPKFDPGAFAQQDNSTDVLKIMIILKKNNLLDIIAYGFLQWLTKDQLRKCLNGLPKEDLCYFVNRKSFQIDQLLLYEILVNWSVSQAGNQCVNALFHKADAKEKEMFLQLLPLLNLAQLRKHSNLICSSRFISFAQMQSSWKKS